MKNDLIVVRQVPVIEEQLVNVQKQIEQRVREATDLECTEATVKDIKRVRAALNKEFQALEEKRKEVKAKIMAPYEQFERVYKTSVAALFLKADRELREKIQTVEAGVKERKQELLLAYFYEYASSLGIDFVHFKDLQLQITLSASIKSLKEQIRNFLERVSRDVALIETQEHRDELMVEYKKSLDITQAVQTIVDRRSAIKKELQLRGVMEEETDAGGEETKIVPPFTVVLSMPEEQEERFKLTFTVTATKSKLKALKQFLTEGGYDYES